MRAAFDWQWFLYLSHHSPLHSVARVTDGSTVRLYTSARSLSLSPRCYDDDDDATPRGEMRKRIGFALECRLLTYNRGRECCEGILKGGRGGARAKERNVRAFSIWFPFRHFRQQTESIYRRPERNAKAIRLLAATEPRGRQDVSLSSENNRSKPFLSGTDVVEQQLTQRQGIFFDSEFWWSSQE